MSITSLTFLVFLLLMVVGYYILPLKKRWIWLLIGSAYFYFSYDHKLSIWLLVSVALIYFFGLWIAHCSQKYKQRIETADKAEKRQLKKDSKRITGYIAFLCAAIQVGIWVVFKFSGVFIGAINRITQGNIEIIDIVAPLGISFYMLQAISYVVDVKRGKCEAQKNPFKLALWLSFFPQMIQGPIARYNDTADQLIRGNRFDWKNIQYGAQLMLWGYFKKLIIANYAAVIVGTVFGDGIRSYHGCEYAIGIIFYAIQIYGDFSGGIDIVSGCAEMLGVHLPVNFRRPYFSKSIQEYWQRWHITLGTWFRDYIFYPLSISKWANNLAVHTRKWFGAKLGNMIPTYIALIIVWSSNGVWHGAGLNFFLYGFYNGVLITLGMQFNEPLGRFAENKLHINRACFGWKLFQMIRTFALVCFGRVLFQADTVRGALHIYKSFFTDFNLRVLFHSFTGSIYGLPVNQFPILIAAILVLLVVSILQERGIHIRDAIAKRNIVLRWVIYLGAFFVVFLLGPYGPGYNAGDFIYATF